MEEGDSDLDSADVLSLCDQICRFPAKATGEGNVLLRWFARGDISTFSGVRSVVLFGWYQLS